jgi:hypothetical protein
MQKIDVYALCWNEILILPYFLRHYEQFAERIFVWDDKSTDGSRELLLSHPKVTLLDPMFEGADDDYSRYVLFPQYIELSTGKADWVMIVDIDEFVYHENLTQQLQRLYDEGADVIRPVGFTMMADSLPKTDGQIYDAIKMGMRDRNFDKKVIFRPEVDILFTPGRHRIDWVSISPKRDIHIRYKSGIKYLHYRYFGLEYYIERLKRNHDRLRMRSAPKGTGDYWIYDPERYWRMPNGVRDTPKHWFKHNVKKATKVI